MKAKSFLFVPSIFPERFTKALQSGASQIIIDLEDSVEVAKKEVGRKNIVDFSSQCAKNNDKFLIRICRRKNKNTPQKNKNTLFGVILFFYKA